MGTVDRTKHVALYLRISDDDERRGEGVAEQERWGREYASRTWPDLRVETYCDNDRSAADRELPRPDFDRLVADITAGKVVHLVARDRNRITRDAAHWLDLADDVLLPAGLMEVHTKFKGVMRVDDIATDFDAVLGRREVRVIRQLVLDKHAALARDGRPHGGRTYGYVSPRLGRDEVKELQIVPEEAEIIRRIADQVLAGWSLENIARELNADGLPAARGGKWWPNQVKRTVTRPTVAGLRVHKGEVVGKATWEPILDESTWRQVGAQLAGRDEALDASGRTWPIRRGKGGRGYRYLLTGLAACGNCGAPLASNKRNLTHRPGPAEHTPYYICHPRKGGKSCVGTRADRFEKIVVDKLLGRLANADFQAAYGADDHTERRVELTAELADVQTRKATLAQRWGVGEIDDIEWAAARPALDERQARLESELAAIPRPVADVDFDGIVADWAELTIDEQRHILGMFIGKVVLNRAAFRGARFDPARIKVYDKAGNEL